MGFVEPYHLAIDVGTSRVAAAVSRLGADGRIHTLPVALGRRGDTVSTVVFVAEDGSLLFGDAAERRGVTEPERLVREFKRSIGDDVPFVVEGHVIAPQRLYAETVASIVDAIAEREGSPAEGVVLTHPVAWGAHRLGLVRDALDAVGLGDVALMTEPEAAARHYEAGRPLDEGQAVAVYDLGGGTFDAVVLRREAGGAFRIVGRPEGINDLGGADFDDQVLRHAIGMAQVAPEHLTVDRDDSRLALAQLRRECVDAKEALSYDSDATIPVLLPSGSPSVRLTRAEFEAMIDDDIARTVDALDDALDSAGIAPADLDCILLIGGSSRIPLVTQRLSERFDRPLAIDADPKSSIALGAARTGLVRTADRTLGVSDDPLAALVPATDADAATTDGADPAEETTSAPVGATDRTTSHERMSKPHLLALAGGTLFFVAAVLFSTSEAAGLLPQQTVAEAPASGSGLTYELPSYAPATVAPPESQPAAAPPAVIEPVADVQESTPDAPAARPKTSTSRPGSDSSSATSKNPRAGESTPAPGTVAAPVSTGGTQTGTGTTPGSTQTGTTEPSPSPTPTATPEPSPEPTQEPSPEPTPEPTTDPTPEPTAEPTPEPSPEPTADPTPEPSPEATVE